MLTPPHYSLIVSLSFFLIEDFFRPHGSLQLVFLIYIYLAEFGLSCIMQDFSLSHMDSLSRGTQASVVATLRLLAAPWHVRS